MRYNRFTRQRGLFGGLDLKQVSEVANGASGVYAQITQGSTALTGTLRGLYAVATNGTTTGTGTIRGAEIKARAADPSGNGANIDGLTGVYVSVDVKAKVGTTIRGFEVSLDGGAGGSSTLAQGLVIFNNSSAVQTTSIAVDVNGGTPTDHKAFTADFRLQNGALIDNAVSGALAFTVAAITFSGTLNVVGNFSVNTTKFTVNATSSDLSSYNQEADATGTTWTVKKSRAAGAACSNSDVLLDIIAQGMNATPTLVTVAELKAILTDKTAGSEDGSFSFLTAVNGTLAERLSIANVVNSTVDFQVATDKFVVTASSGATVIKSTFGAGTGGTTFTVAADGALAIATTMFTVSAAGAVNAKGAVAFGANLTEFAISTAGDIVTYNQEADASGTYWISKKSRAGGAVAVATDTIYQLDFQGMNATPALKTVGNMVAQIMNIGAGTESGRIFFSTMVEGAAATSRLTAAADVTVGLPEAIGSYSFIVTDSVPVTKFRVNSLGNLTSKNNQAAATGVTWSVSKSRAADAACTANDVILQMDGIGRNATPAWKAVTSEQHIITNIGAGTEAGAILFLTMTAGAVITEKFRIGDVLNNSVQNFAVNTDFWKVTALTGDVAQKNVEVDATGVTHTVTKARAAAVCVANDVIWQLISSGMNSTPAQKTVVNLKTLITDPTAGSEDGAFTVETVTGGAAIAEVFRLDGTGIVLPATVTRGIRVGSTATAFGSGVPLNITNYQGSGFFCDDGGVALTTGASIEGVMARCLITQVIAGDIDVSASALHGSTWVRANYTGSGGMSGIWGQFSVPTGVTVINNGVGDADMAGGHFSVNFPTGATLASGSRGAGVSVGGNLGGTITGALLSGFRVRAPSAGTWTYILHADAAAAAASKHGIFIGASAAAHGSGIPLSETNYQANGFFADDGGVPLTGSTENVMVRYAINEIISGGAVSASALHASQWVYANYTGIGNLSGVWAHFLIPTGVTIDNSAGARAIVSALHASLDLVSGGTLAASSQAAGVSVSGNLGGTITGVASGVRVLSPSAGNWTYGIDLNGMGTPTADIRLANGATLFNSAAGALALALGTRTGTAASNGLGITLTDSTTFGTGVGNAVSLLVTAGGNRTGGASTRFNGILDQVTVTGTGNINGMYIRMPKGDSPNLATNLVSGLVVDMKELGATDYFSNIFLHKFNTTKGTGLDAFIVCALQELGVAKTGIYFQGINLPDNFLTIQPGSNRDMLVTGTPTGSTKRYLKVDLDGVAYGIELNSVA